MNTSSDKLTARLEYQITIDDYIEANNAYKKTSKFGYYSYLVIGWLSIFVGFVLMILTNFYYYLSYVLLLLGLLFILMPTLLYRISVKDMWKKEPSIRELLTVTISEDNLGVKSSNTQTTSNWAAYTNFIETKNLFLIFRQRNAFVVIPKRAFENIETENEFRYLLKKKFAVVNKINKA